MKNEISNLFKQKKMLDAKVKKMFFRNCFLNEFFAKLANLQGEMFEAQKTSELRSEIANLTQELESKKQKCEDLLDQHKNDLKKRLGTLDSSEIRFYSTIFENISCK